MTQSLFDDPVSALITGGLGMDACESMIIARWHIGPCEIVFQDQNQGAIPLAHGQSQKIFTPIQNGIPHEQPFLSPYKGSTPQQHVKITVKIGEKSKSRDFFVPKERSKPLIKIVKLVNTTMRGYHVVVTKIKTLTNAVSVKIKNLRTKHDK